ncbi:MAG: hypothetical protein LUE17_01420 [Planctomycetaceae bacterium]|nr:hypothetical protein [Planctomycetaceae bacterium]
MTNPRRCPYLLAFVLCALVSGCDEARHVTAALGSSSKPYHEYLEDPVTLTTIKTVAVLPFADKAPQPGFDSTAFANKLANELAAYGKVRVLYPRDILAAVERDNRNARRHNAQLRERIALGLATPDDDGVDDGENSYRGFYNPIENYDEAVKLARRAKADAVIVGEVSDYDPYMRPRLSITMKLIATGSTDTAAQAIAEMTQWGIPRSSGGASGGGTVYVRQQSFDSKVGSVGMDVSKYGRTHFIEHNPYDTEVFVRSMTHYYDVVAHELAAAYFDARKKAIKEAEDRAKAKAKQDNIDQERAMQRLAALMERDSRIPDHESSIHPEGYWDQAFPDKRAVIAANGQDKRILSWRPQGQQGRMPTPAEKAARDMMIPENERGRGLEGYSAMVDSSFPDADSVMEGNLGNNRDRRGRPDYYLHANPDKAAPLYGQDQYIGNR